MKFTIYITVFAFLVITLGIGASISQAIDLSLLSERVFEGDTTVTPEGFGTKIAIGDVNGDGIDDLVAGAPFSDHKLNAGTVYIWFGPISEATQVASSADVIILGADSPDQLGSAIAVGDLDLDGTNELIIGAPETLPQGSVYIFEGPILGTSTGPKIIDMNLPANYAARIIGGHLPSGSTGDNTGGGLAVGELTGDAFPDIAIGATGPDVNGENSGAVYVIAGNGTLDAFDVNLSLVPPAGVILGPSFKAIFGRGLAVGDLDGDSQSDVVVGAQDAFRSGTRLGETYVIQGPITGVIDLSSSPPDPKVLLRIDGVDTEDVAGIALAIGDLDYDGSLDLLIGAAHADMSDGDSAGEVHFLSNPLNGALSNPHRLTTATIEFIGEPGDAAGSGLAVGDVNNDGRQNLAIGAPSIVGGAGKVTAFFDNTPVPTPTPGPPFDPPGPPDDPGPPTDPGPPIDPPGRGR
ncbi:MAG: hypothetical protein HOC77_12685 [Chloroflexi bacterium]|jgi:hypothetical protein|nr:hypothetical protein [Chloroflexota bacterium]MBT4074749.1 hypothetical protein [Chloroflexota bacterium]MBT4515932.1 hypothetical protein [Chloroflexota bacterium]MBT5318519.1 hypothetical protein [Chloroflexota bacterium]MBT6681618.1 hypothetical protein [Chloroflexota bacterium]